ncbi:MAG: RecX family transcriptional regulator [Pseudomonadota bacterium]|nr:RecX family transcriptional regulator [Pseudomonadota bacterium]
MSEPKRARKARKNRPLDENALRDLALSYVARFATTGAKVEAYLARKIRERGIAEDADGRVQELDVTGIVTRLIELGYVDDAAYARSRSRDLTARGYGKRRVEQALYAAGVEDDVRADSVPDGAASRRAAMLLAKKRGIGPFMRADKREDLDDMALHKLREKHTAAMLRAGHDFEHARFILDAADADIVEDWVIEAEEEARDDV